MEDDMRKEGALFLQQQRFGKRWRKVWCVLFRENHCSVSRLEIFDWSERSVRKQQDNKKVIRLSSCIRVSSVDVEGAPRDTCTFLMETTEKIFVFAADRLQADEWMQRLCEIAFPKNWVDSALLLRTGSERKTRSEPHLGQNHAAAACMEDNSLYDQCESSLVQEVRVVVRRTDASDRCRLKGDGILRADSDALLLLTSSRTVLFSWPYRYLRRFGRDKSTFSFEAGRRCDSGEGSFEFETKLGNALFTAVDGAINRQRVSLPQRQTSMGLESPTVTSRTLPPRPEEPDPVYSFVSEASLQLTHTAKESSSPTQRPHQCRLELPVDKVLTAVKSLTLENRDPPLHRKNQVKPINSCPLPLPPEDPAPSTVGHSPSTTGHASPKATYSQIAPKRRKKVPKSLGSGKRSEMSHNEESEYSQPFDRLTHDPPQVDPLYDSIDEFHICNVFHRNKQEHIYDEPEGCELPGLNAKTKMAVSLYDEPEEVRGNAWRIMGSEQDPKGHEFPYNPCVDDYAVPKHAQRAFPKPHTEPQEPDKDQDLDLGLNPELNQDPDPALDRGLEWKCKGLQDTVSPYNNLPIQMGEGDVEFMVSERETI